MIKKLPLLLALSTLSLSAQANPKLLGMLTSFDKNNQDYQMGSEWGKKKVTSSSLKSKSAAFVRAAKATAFMPVGATGFYIGKFSGKHILATNHHVCPKARECEGSKADFKILGKKFKMQKLLISEPSIDLALLVIDIPAKDEALMASVAKNFSFKKDLYKGQPLITIGFGIGNNPLQHLVGNEDSDCKVFSESSDYKLLKDPDEINPGGYSAWSFAHACDISHGDSGSAMVDRNTSEVVGIVWTGRIPKIPMVQDSNNLNDIFTSPSSIIWEEFSFAVPARKIGEHLGNLSSTSSVEAETREIFKAIIQ